MHGFDRHYWTSQAHEQKMIFEKQTLKTFLITGATHVCGLNTVIATIFTLHSVLKQSFCVSGKNKDHHAEY